MNLSLPNTGVLVVLQNHLVACFNSRVGGGGGRQCDSGYTSKKKSQNALLSIAIKGPKGTFQTVSEYVGSGRVNVRLYKYYIFFLH